MSRNWYVLRTYTQYENKVENRLRALFELPYEDFFFDIKVPVEEVEVLSGAKRQVVERKLWPGYVLLELDVSHPAWKGFWATVRQIPGVSGFLNLGSQGKPLPLNTNELGKVLQFSQKNVKLRRVIAEFAKGDLVQIVQGPFASFQGVVDHVDGSREQLHVNVQIFGRDTSVEVGFVQVTKVVS